MVAPLTFDIPHSLGADEAKRRIEAGLPKLEKHIPGGGTVAASWNGPQELQMTIIAMAQRVGVHMTIEDRVIRASVTVPLMLSMMAEQISELVETSARKMLAPPKSE